MCRYALACWTLLALVACEQAPKSHSSNPFNTPSLVSYWGMAVIEAPDGSLIVGSSNVASTGMVQQVRESGVTKLLSRNGDFLRAAAGFLYVGVRRGPFDQALARMPITGGRVEWLSARAGIHGLAVDEEYVYWLTSDPEGRIFRLPHSGGTTEVLHEAEHGLGSLEIDDTHLYWITTQGVSRVPKAGGEEELLLAPDDWQPYLDSWPASLALSARHVFVAGGAGFVGSRGAVLRLEKDGSSVSLVAAGQDGASLTFADHDYVYWVRGYTNDAISYPGRQDIVRMPLEGGQEEIVADQQNGVTSMLRTADGLYWTSRNERFLNFASMRR